VQIFGLMGLVIGAVGLAITIYLAYVKYFRFEAIGNRPLLTFGVLFIMTGVQLITVGLLAELMSRTYHESQDKPTYTIREIREAPPVEYRHSGLVETSRAGRS
jgi:hypothetical protein